MKANLLRLQNEWETFQATNARDAVYQYLTAVFELVSWWAQEGRAVDRAHRALHLRGHHSVREPEAFAAVIHCTADRAKLMTGRGANGPVCYGTPRNTRTWVSRCGISSSAGVVSTNVRPGLLVAGLRRSHACAIKTHRLFMLSF